MKSLIELLSDLRALGILLSVDGERLICNAPKGVVTPEIRKVLAERKPDILAFLRESTSSGARSDRSTALVDLPLSRSQQRLWFLAQVDPGNPVYNVVIALRLTGELDRPALERSLQMLVDRHESLRTLFYARDGVPFARVVEGAAWTSAFLDLSTTPEAQAEEEARRLSRLEARQPFDPIGPSLFRASLFRIAEQRHLLLLVVHHMVADGWSLGIIARELGILYEALATEKQPELPAIDFQYRDYVRWEQTEGEKIAQKQMPYWLDRLSGSLPILEFMGDRRRPPRQTFHGKRLAFHTEPVLSRRIRELCRASGATPYMLLLAAFNILVARYTGVDDILVGSGVSNRNSEEVAPLIGCFVNTLVLRTDLTGNLTFEELVSKIKEIATSAFAHQEIPFDLLVEKLQPRRWTSHSPIVQVMFTFQNLPIEPIALRELTVEHEELDPGIARMDISIEVWPEPETFRCDFEFNTDLFDDATIRAMHADFSHILQIATADPAVRIKDISLLSKREQRELPIERNRTNAERTAEHPLSRSQRRLWFLNQLDPGDAVYNIAIALAVDGPLRPEALKRSLEILVERHESLRTRFLQREGEPYAVVEDGYDWQPEFVDYSFLAPASRQEEVLQFARDAARKPFILERGLLFRASVLKKSSDQHVLVLVMHHIISDGWSLGVLARELGVIYEALAKNHACPLPPPQFRFRDFVAWEQQESALSYEADLQYWRQKLAGELPLLELPLDHARPALQTFHGQRVSASISAGLADQLEKLSRGQNATLFMTLLAAFNVLLRRYSGQDDILVGTPTAGRLKREFEGVVGIFINNLVLRTDLSGNPSFVALVQQIRKTAFEAFEHQSIPFDQLVEILQPERSLNQSPIFQVMFTLQNAPVPSLRLDDLEMKPLDFQRFYARYDLAVDIYAFEGHYRCDFEFNTDIFDAAMMEQMQQHYIGLLETVASDAEIPLAALSLLSEGERRRIVEEWNRTEMPLQPYATVPVWFHAQVEKSPDALALSMGERSLTYGELDAQSSRLAAVLRSQGVVRETVVGVFLQRSPEMVVGLLAILKAGGAYLPLDPVLPAHRLEFLLSDARVPLILTQTGLRDTVPATDAALLLLDQLLSDRAVASIEEPVTDEPAPEDLAYLIYTSGSTGDPKGTEVPHRALVNLLASMLREPGLASGDTLVAVTTLSFDIAGLEILGPLVCGARLVLASTEQALDPDALAGLLEQSEATVMQATPSTWRMLIDSGWMGTPNLRMWCGGEALSPDLADNLLVRGRELWNLYGPTETTIWSTAHRVKSGESPILIGRPIANTRMYILDSDGQPAPIGVPGELYIGGAGVARGYRGRPAWTEARFVNDSFAAAGSRMYRTGDLARYRPDGQIQLIGRTDHQIKLRGHRIELGEIEVVIERHPQVRQAVVVLDGDGADQRLVAYVTQSEGATDTESLRSWLQSRLPDYMVPSLLIPVAEIALTPNGKVDRKRLPKPKASPRESSASVVVPRNQTEERLARIWSEILRVDRPGVRDNFFDLGGHSLLLIRVHARLRRELDADVAVIDLFRYPTIESMASWLDRRSQAAARLATGVGS